MTITASIAVFFIIWWTVLFMVLPFGVRSQAETGDVTAGTEPGAPIRPVMLRKALWTTGISVMVFAALNVAIRYVEL
jgi:predicted secreted protein